MVAAVSLLALYRWARSVKWNGLAGPFLHFLPVNLFVFRAVLYPGDRHMFTPYVSALLSPPPPSLIHTSLSPPPIPNLPPLRLCTHLFFFPKNFIKFCSTKMMRIPTIFTRWELIWW